MFKQKMLFYKLFSSFKIMRANKGIKITFNLNILTSWQNIINLDSNFEAHHVGNVHANFLELEENEVTGR